MAWARGTWMSFCGLGEEDGFAGEVRERRDREGHGGAKEDRGAEDFRPEQQKRGGDIGSVRVAEGGDVLRAKAILGSGGNDEIGKFVGAELEIFEVEDAHGEAAEEARHAVFEDFASRTEEACAGEDGAAERQEVTLIAAGSVEKQEDGGGGRAVLPLVVKG